MIVKCPNCHLEQPYDKYCAGCGKELDKLLHEQKKQKMARIKKTNLIILSLALFFLVGSFLYYSQLKKESQITQDESSSTMQEKLDLPKDTIKGEPTAKVAAADVKPAPVKEAKPQPKKVKKTTQSLVGKESKSKKIDTFYIISTDNCAEVFEIGELEQDQIKELLGCAKVFLRTNKKTYDDILEDGISFATQVTIRMDEFLIETGFNLTTDSYVEEFKQTLPLAIDEDSVATLWESVGHDIESVEEPSDEMLASYATSALFNFNTPNSPPAKLYFLATYN